MNVKVRAVVKQADESDLDSFRVKIYIDTAKTEVDRTLDRKLGTLANLAESEP